MSARREYRAALLDAARPRRLLGLREWAERRLVIPTGPHAGERWRPATQPWTALLLDAIDAGRADGGGPWEQVAVTGPSQSGKSLFGYVVPALYHLAEVGETIVFAAPDADMAGDKWRLDLLPTLEASTDLATLLPRTGEGARGARRVVAPRLTNGATLRVITAGGGDKSRAGFTARVVVATEIDGYDDAGDESDEGDKLTQILARSRAYRDRVAYLECTVSTPDGAIWRTYQEGTASRIARPCPRCGRWVTPEREHLRGWQEAASADEAARAAYLACPACDGVWTEDERVAALARAVLVHRGQDVDEEGRVTGPPPATGVLGFRSTAADNALLPLGAVAADEWRAARRADRDVAERALRQFAWALPVERAEVDETALDVSELARSRPAGYERGALPGAPRAVALGVDVGKHLLHWVLVALRDDGGPHVVDYGRVEVATEEAPERGLARALAALRERATEGWHGVAPAAAWVDAGYQADIVEAACDAGAPRWVPSRGLGWHQRRTGAAREHYRAPQRTDARVADIGVGWHMLRRPGGRRSARVDADHWKTWLHDRLRLPLGSEGAATLFVTTSSSDHLPFLRHLTSERRVARYRAGVGLVTTWENPTGRNNHWLDAACYACAAAHYVAAHAAPAAPPADYFAGRRGRRRAR